MQFVKTNTITLKQKKINTYQIDKRLLKDLFRQKW